MNIFLSSGIGDFFGIVSCMTQKERDSVTAISWATRQRKVLQQFVPLFFPNVQNQYVLCDDFTKSEELNTDPMNSNLIDRFCVHSLGDLYNRFPVSCNIDASQIKDYSVQLLANACVKNERFYTGISELKQNLADISHVELPKVFFFIHPWSDNQRYMERDFTLNECRAVVNYLSRIQIPGVIINKSSDMFPIQSKWIIDLTNKTDYFESIEVLKEAQGFIGSSSSFSVLASKFLEQENVIIKAPDSIRNSWYKFYYLPYTTNEFCHKSLMFLR